MEEFMTVAIVISILFIGLPWLVLHYITQWKKTGSLTGEDEKLLDEMQDRKSTRLNSSHT